MTEGLILATWIAWLGGSLGIGVVAANAMRLAHTPTQRLRLGLWLGVFLLITVALVANFFTPMGGAAGSTLAALWLLIGWGALLFWLWANRQGLKRTISSAARFSNSFPLAVIAMLVVALVLAARFAAAEPMDADAGLYRLGSINYAAEFPAIPGLANLHDRFGFNSALWPLAALFGNGLWEGNGFRIVTGFFLTLLVADIAMRIGPAHRRRSPGDVFMLLALGFAGWVILTDTGRWIPSPAQDIVALTLAIGATALLVDFVDPRSRHPWTAYATLLTATAAGAIRPLGWLLLPVSLLVILVASRLHRPARSAPTLQPRPLALTLGLCAGLVIAMLIRDLIVSGWLLFPLSILPMPVDWRAPDPTNASRWILSWGRAPGENADVVLANNDWFRPWLGRFAESQEFRLLMLLGIACLLPLLWRQGRSAWRDTRLSILLAWSPSVLSAIAWFVTSPDLRFGWAGLIGIVGVPLAFLLAHGAYPRWAIRVAFLSLLLLGAASAYRNGRFEPRGAEPQVVDRTVLGVAVPLRLAPTPFVRLTTGALGDGTPIVHPVTSGSCYDVFPLCLLPDSGSTVERRGSRIADGFRQIR